MKCPRADQFPYSIKVGSVTTKVYVSTSTKGYKSFFVAYHVNGKRLLKNCAHWDDAYENARGIALKLSQGEVQVAELSAANRASFGRATAALRPTGVQLDVAATEYAEAHKLLAGRTTLLDAVRFYVSRHQEQTSIDVPDAVAEFLRTKTTDGAKNVYLKALKVHLGKFSRAFSCAVSSVRTSELGDFLRTMPVSNRSRQNCRGLLGVFFNHAKERGWISRHEDPMEHVPNFKAEAHDVTIYTPDELVTLLTHARLELIPYLTIAAFAGLRSAELQRLDWSNVALEHGVIEVNATKAKTASRRAVPIPPNLRGWLMPHFQKAGRIVPFDNLPKQLGWLAEAAGMKWKKNALRHSFCSYRLAIVKDSAQVAYEAGNSSDMIYRHYHEIVRQADARSWFLIETAGGPPGRP